VLKRVWEGVLQEVVAYLLCKAEQCRRLAAEFLNPNDPAVKNLRALADEFEARAQRRRQEVSHPC
jgi:hypothetical protein